MSLLTAETTNVEVVVVAILSVAVRVVDGALPAVVDWRRSGLAEAGSVAAAPSAVLVVSAPAVLTTDIAATSSGRTCMRLSIVPGLSR